MTVRPLPLVCALLCSVSHSLAAQQAVDISVGTRVRIRLPEALPQPESRLQRWQLLRGEVIRVAPDTLLLRPAPGLGELAVPLSQVQQLERSLGRQSRGESALLEGIEWAVGGALTLAISYERSGSDYGVVNRGEAAALGAGIGFVTGALWGALTPAEKWRRVRLRQ